MVHEEAGGLWFSTDDQKVALIFDHACNNGRVGKPVENSKICQHRFCKVPELNHTSDSAPNAGCARYAT